MKNVDWFAPVLTAVGLTGLAVTFAFESRAFKESVESWALRDLTVRTELAASTLREPLATSDFSRIHAFGDACSVDGVRLTIYSAEGGLFFDSLQKGAVVPEALYATQPCGEFSVRLGLPRARVLAPFTRARLSLLLAGLVGGAGVLLVFFFTYRQRMRLRALARLEKFRREFIADLSHEIKTPLTGILGAADLLRDSARNETEAHVLSLLEKETKRLNQLAQNVLDLARLEDSEKLLHKTSIRVVDFAEELCARVQPHASRAQMTLSLACALAREEEMVADAQLLEQAVVNLLENAVRHSGSPTVVLHVSATAHDVCWTVEDRGMGVPKECRARIFERFGRVDAARSSEKGGAGLGLAIVRRIAQLHCGTVTFEPVNPTGSRFTLKLPRT